MVSCSACKKRSAKANYTRNGISYHRFPNNPALRKIWRDFCHRPSSWMPKRTSNLCSVHFEPSCFQPGNRRRLNDNAVPTLFACECKRKCTATHGAPSSSIDDAESAAASPHEHASSASDDSEAQIPDLPVTVKVEVDEEDVSEHEEDIMEKLENRKRMHEQESIAVDAKKVRVELVPVADTQLEQTQYQVIVQPQQSHGQTQAQYVGVLQPPLLPKFVSNATQSQAQQQPDASESVVLPEFFMNVVVQNQNEILSILKRQVLLQDPDPELLTFLRFLGSRLLRLPKKKRDELQDKITDMVYKE